MNSKNKKVSYRPAWEREFSWVQKDNKPEYAYCKVCESSFRINNSGLSQVRTHSKTQSHKEKESLKSGKTSQRVLVSKDNELSVSSQSLTFSFYEQVVNAEIL